MPDLLIQRIVADFESLAESQLIAINNTKERVAKGEIDADEASDIIATHDELYDLYNHITKNPEEFIRKMF